MKIVPQYEENMVSTGLTDSTKMTFSTDVAHLFALLSKNLYSDPQLAAVREIITNAWDAHIEAGITDIPIQIREEEDSFVIQDFGTGISPEKFIELYGVVGGSSKREDNRQTGGMGIGKMAPLAAMPHFSVKSHYNGTATVYHIAGPTEESGGIPTITKVVEHPTDITGMEVIFPVSILNFSHHIRSVICMGAIKAEYVTGNEVTLLETIEDTDFVYMKRNYGNISSIYFRYGNISYSFPIYKIFDLIPSSEKLGDLLEIFDMEMIIKLPPGIAVVTPNREDLVITDTLKEYLEVRLEEAYQDLLKTLRKTLITGSMEVTEFLNFYPGANSLIAEARMKGSNGKRNFMSYQTCHEPSFSVYLTNWRIIPELRDVAVANFNKSIPKSFRGIHKPTVLNKLEKSFKRLIIKSGITLKNVYTFWDVLAFNSRASKDSHFLFNLACNRKIVIHYGYAIPKGARKTDILYIRIPKRVDVNKLKSRLECLFGKEMDIQIWEETANKKPQSSKSKESKKARYVCASVLLAPERKYQTVDSIISAADKTVEEPKVVLASRDVGRSTKTFLNILGEEAIKEAGIVLVTNFVAGSLLRRKSPPERFKSFFENYITKFLEKPEVLEYSKYYSFRYDVYTYSPVNDYIKKLCKEVLDIDLKISKEDISFFSWVQDNYYYLIRHFFFKHPPEKDIPENVKTLIKFSESGIIPTLHELNLYDTVIAELRKRLND